MPIYEFRCRTCDERFEVRRPMRDADAPGACPRGHDDVVRLLPVFATTGHAHRRRPRRAARVRGAAAARCAPG